STRGDSRTLDREKPLEERTVPAQRHAQVLGRDLLVAPPLCFEARPLAREEGREIADDLIAEGLRRLHGLARIVDEAALDVTPLAPELGCPIVLEKARPGLSACVTLG